VYDQHDVCGQAHAAYYEARVWIVMGYTAGDNYFNEAIKAVSRLTESFPSACGADGKNFAAQAAAELDKLKERHRQDVARQRRGQR
jgi:hypothetical protein